MINRIEWKVAIKTGLSAGFALFLGLFLSSKFHRPDTIISGMWSALAAIVVQQAHLGSTYRSAWIRFLGVFIGCAMGGLFTTLLGSNPISLCLSIILTVAICSIFGLKDSVRISCLSVAVVMVLWGLRPSTSPWLFGFFRFLDSCLGIGVAVIIAHVLWPAQVSTKISKNVGKTFQYLSKLLNWSVYIKPLSVSEENIYRQLALETDELLWKNNKFLEDSKLELLSNHAGLEEWKLLFGHLDQIFERINVLKNIYKINLETMILETEIKHEKTLQDFEFESRLPAVSRVMYTELGGAAQDVILSANETLQNFAEAVQGACPLAAPHALQKTLERLGHELTRFRGKKVTRQYELKDVEGFFVFFYSLRALGDALQKTYTHLGVILSGDY